MGRIGVGRHVAAAAVVGALLWVPTAGAQIIGPQDPDNPQGPSSAKEDGWQAGTCTADPPSPPTARCSVETPGLFFEEAAGHPPVGFTQIIVNKDESGVPVEALRTVRVDIPPGFTVNPQATGEAAPAWCEGPSPSSCPAHTKVGISYVEATNPETGASLELPPVDVFNMKPEHGEPARFGFTAAGNDVFLETGIAWEDDYHEHFTIHAHEVKLPLEALEELDPLNLLELLPGGEPARIAKNRLVFFGDTGANNGTFLSTPPTCFGPALPASANSPFEHVYSTWLRADGHDNPDPNFPHGSPFVEAKIPPGTSPKNCDDIPFDPSISVDPKTTQTDSPAGAAVTVNLPETKNPLKDEASKATSHVRSAELTLPPGMGLNPSAANGLAACSDAQFGKGTRNPVACPAASRVGTVEVDTPPLPDGSLSGAVYVGRQLSRDPLSGDLYRIFVTVESSRFDISARLLGKVRANPQTGRLTTTFDDSALGKVPLPGLPQVPFESFRFKFNGGARAPLTSPSTCGPHATTTTMTPWSGNPAVTRSDRFSLAGLPGGGACPNSLGERPFALGFGADADSPQGGAFSPLHMDIARSDGNQELKGVDITLPPGLSAKLAGVSYCPEPSLAAAGANSGVAEAAGSSCPASSYIGSARVAAGSGPSPIEIGGKVFLAGPYKGAPLSLAVLTPATAGPFDLGTVVVRVALFVDPRTAQVRAVSDPIPHVYGGATLGIRSVAVRIDRPDFSLNPTNCSQFASAGSLLGGGANPLDPGAFSSAPASAPFKAAGCERLRFRPRIFLRLFGATRRAKNPKLRAVVLPRKGNANIARAATILPRSLILDQGNLSKVCTRVQFAARKCPRNSIYGHARAFSPLLDRPLKGPVYLRSSDNVLPDLVAALRGQVEVELASRTDSVRGRIRNIFDIVPDVPVSKFILTMRGGRKGLLVNSRNQCPRKRARRGDAKRSDATTSKKRRARRRGQRAIVRFKAQNGKKRNLRPRLRTPCGQKRTRGNHRRKHGN
jgi:hypothetical protein